MNWSTVRLLVYTKNGAGYVHDNIPASIQDPKEKPATCGDVFPSVWYQEFDGGRQWYTSLGHNKDDYGRPEFRRHILGGIQSVVRRAPLDYSRAYARSPSDEPRTR